MTTPTLAPLPMVDLKTQYQRFKTEIDQAVLGVLESTQFIGGPQVQGFREQLEQYLGVAHVIPCANGTDALQIAMMALGLKPGDEVIVPAFTYVATAEVIGLLGLTPVMVDVDANTFNLRADDFERAITPRTRAVVPVHLFGQSADMEPILEVAARRGIYVIEDNAQAIGADYTFSDGRTVKAGTMGHFGCTSFFPSKNLGCFGDGGAIMTNDADLAERARMIASHGQSKLYYHDVIGVNSRLDAMQAAILAVKLRHLDEFNAARQRAAAAYDQAFASLPGVTVPPREPRSTHVFHQYTLQVPAESRQALKEHLQQRGVPSMVYYPVPLYRQPAFAPWAPAGVSPLGGAGGGLPVTEALCQTVISLPMHSEHTEETLGRVIEGVTEFFNK